MDLGICEPETKQFGRHLFCDFCPRNIWSHVGFDLPPELFRPEIEFPLPISLSRSVSQTRDKSSIATWTDRAFCACCRVQKGAWSVQCCRCWFLRSYFGFVALATLIFVSGAMGGCRVCHVHLSQLRGPRWRLDGFYFYLSQRRVSFLDLKEQEKLETQIRAFPVQDSRRGCCLC